MLTRTWIRCMLLTALFLMKTFVIAETEAQLSGGIGRGFGGNIRDGGGPFRGGAVDGEGWKVNRPQRQGSPQAPVQQLQSRQQTGDAVNQASRQNTAKDIQARQQVGDAANREDWQSQANQGREDQQSYRSEAREDWQDCGDDHGRYYGGYYGGYPAYPVGGVAAGMAVGSTMTAAAFNAQKASCRTLVVNGVSYYQCGSTWYQPSYQGSRVTYVVVNPPK